MEMQGEIRWRQGRVMYWFAWISDWVLKDWAMMEFLLWAQPSDQISHIHQDVFIAVIFISDRWREKVQCGSISLDSFKNVSLLTCNDIYLEKNWINMKSHSMNQKYREKHWILNSLWILWCENDQISKYSTIAASIKNTGIALQTFISV